MSNITQHFLTHRNYTQLTESTCSIIISIIILRKNSDAFSGATSTDVTTVPLSLQLRALLRTMIPNIPESTL